MDGAVRSFPNTGQNCFRNVNERGPGNTPLGRALVDESEAIRQTLEKPAEPPRAPRGAPQTDLLRIHLALDAAERAESRPPTGWLLRE